VAGGGDGRDGRDGDAGQRRRRATSAAKPPAATAATAATVTPVSGGGGQRLQRSRRRRTLAAAATDGNGTGPASLPPLPFETRLTPGFVRRHPSPTPPIVQPLVLALDVTVLAGRDPDEDGRTSRTGRSSRSRTRDMSSAVGRGAAAGQRCEFYVALVRETPALVGPLQTLISVVPTLVRQAVSIDLRPGVAAVLHHEERQSAATAAAGLAGRMGRSAAPGPLAAHPRLLLRIAHRTGDGRRAEPAPGVEHVLHKDGKWVGLCARGGGTVALGDALNGWQMHLSWVGGLSPLDVLSTYSVFLGRPGHLTAVSEVASAAAEMAAAAEALVVADHFASQGPMTAPREPCTASPAAKLFSLRSFGGGGVPAVPRVDADGEELVGRRRTPAVFDRSAPTPFDVEYLEYRPGRKAQPFRRHIRKDARCPLCNLDARTVGGPLDHLRALHTVVSVELFRAVSAAELEGAAAAASSGGGRGWDRCLAHIRWVSTPMLLPGLFESAGWVQSTAGAVRLSSRLPHVAAAAPGIVHPDGRAPWQPLRDDHGVVRSAGVLREGGGAGPATAAAAFLRRDVSFSRHTLAAGASRRRPRLYPRSGKARVARRTLATARADREYFHTGGLAPLSVKQSPKAELSSDSEDGVEEDWLHSMDAARLEALELPSHDVLFMALWPEYVDAAPPWGDRGAAFLLGGFFVARRRTILETGLLAQAVAHVEVMYTHGLLDVDAAAQAIGVLTDRSCSGVPSGSSVGTDNGLDPEEAAVAAAASVAASDARAAAAERVG